MQPDASTGLGDWAYIGEAIRYGRRRAGLTQGELAEAARVDRKTIGNYERGRVPASAPRIPDGYFQVAQALRWRNSDVHRLLKGPAVAAPAPRLLRGVGGAQAPDAGAGAESAAGGPGEGHPGGAGGVTALAAAGAAGRVAGAGVRAAAGADDPLRLFPVVVRFGRACAALGADPALRDHFEDAAQALLRQAGEPRPLQEEDLGLAAYRPHGWAEGDPAVPEDDAARIRQALEEYERNR